MMDATQAAACIQGNEYGTEIPRDIRDRMKEARLVAIYGASDDLTIIDGALRDEMGAFNGATHRLTKDGFYYNRCDCDDCPNFTQKLPNVHAKWDVDGFSWVIETTLPHATFEIVEDGEPYCRGVVVSTSDLPA